MSEKENVKVVVGENEVGEVEEDKKITISISKDKLSLGLNILLSIMVIILLVTTTNLNQKVDDISKTLTKIDAKQTVAPTPTAPNESVEEGLTEEDKKFYATDNIKEDGIFTQKEDDYLVYFYMETCQYCKKYNPVLRDYLKQDKALKIYKVDIGTPETQSVWKNLNVTGTPTIIRVGKNGDKKVETWRTVGFRPDFSNLPIEGSPVTPSVQ